MIKNIEKKSLIREGLNVEKKLKRTFYTYLHDKCLDWALVLGITFLVLPYIGSTSSLFLMVKLLLSIILAINLLIYIRDWKRLEEYNEVFQKAKESFPKLYDKEKLRLGLKTTWKEELSNSTKKITEDKKLWFEFSLILNEFVDFMKLIQSFFGTEIKNYHTQWNSFIKKKDNLNLSFTSFLALFSVILTIRIIPIAKLKNYKRLRFTMILVIIFFIVHFIEISFLEEITDLLNN